MKKRILSLLLSIAMCLTLLPLGTQAQAAYFRDVPSSHWAKEYIDEAVDLGLFNGTGDNQFSPSAAMTRSMFVTVLYRLDGGEAESSANFTDVPRGSWYSDAVAWASENSIVTGTGGGRFSPKANVTREQLITILYRYLNAAGATLEDSGTSVTFRDSSSISSYARPAVQAMKDAGIIGGKPDSYGGYRFDPRGKATRAEVASIMCRFLESVNYDDIDDDVDTSSVIECKDYAQSFFEDAEYDYSDDDGLVPIADLSKVLAAYKEQAEYLREEGIITKYNINDDNITVWLAAGGAYIHMVPIKELQDYAGTGMMTYEPRRGYSDSDADKSFKKSQDKYGSIRSIGSKVASADSRFPYNNDFGGTNVTVSSLKEWGAGSVILWVGHGAYDKTLGPCLVTNEKVTDDNKYAADRSNDRIVLTDNNDTDDDYYVVTSKFFDQYYKNNSLNGSMIWLGACNSARDNRLTDVLLNKGASTVIGNTNPAYIPRLIYMTNEFFGNLTSIYSATGNPYTAGEALRAAKNQADAKKIIDDTLSVAAGGALRANELVIRGNENWTLGSGATVSGYVVDEDNKPISGATVSITGTSQKTTTASNGSYTLSGAASNQTISLTAEAQGYASQTQTVAVGATKATLNFAMKATGKIKLRIMADSGESSIDSIYCEISQKVGNSERVIDNKTFTSRSITLYDLTVGQEYKVKVVVKGYEWAYATTTAEKSPTEIQVKLVKENISLMPDKPDNSTSTDLPDADSDGWTYVYNSTQLTNALKANRNIKLMADVSDVYGVESYSGILDGNGHTVSNPKTIFSLSVATGWISYLKNGTIKNLKIADINFQAKDTTCDLGLIGTTQGSCTIDNCIILSGQISNINSDSAAGAFVGGGDGNLTIKNCVNMASVSAISDSNVWAFASGMIGYSGTEISTNFTTTVKISHCLNLGSIYAEAGRTASAIASGISNNYNYDSSIDITITNCGNGGEISAKHRETSSYAVASALSPQSSGVSGYATQKYNNDSNKSYLSIVSRDTLLSMWSDVLN